MAYTTVNKSSLHFNTKLYTGTGSTNAITGVGFQPDWVWIKRREIKDHNLVDAVRGVQNAIASNTTDAQGAYSNNLSAFGTDGFTLGTGTLVNASGGTYASWNWKAGGGQGSSNTDGSINTTYTSVNTTSGFSISTYTGTGANATVGHGLGVAPKMIIIKSTSHTSNWGVYHKSIGAGKMLNLNSSNAEATNNGYFNSTDPTSSVFSLGDEGNDTNGSGKTYVAYCFAEKTGFSKVGIYTGINDVNGPLIFTGFKPAWLMYKETTSGTSQNWTIVDNKREPNNVMGKLLHPDLTNAESDQTGSTAINIDFLSTGFKVRGSDANINGGSKTYIYFAFAEEPVVGSNNIPSTAR